MDFSINFKIDTRIRPRSSAGCNRLYNDDKGTGYFLLDFSDFEKLHRIYIHTNRWNLVGTSQLPPLVVHSTSKRPNIKFLISCCLTYIFTFGKKYLNLHVTNISVVYGIFGINNIMLLFIEWRICHHLGILEHQHFFDLVFGKLFFISAYIILVIVDCQRLL